MIGNVKIEDFLTNAAIAYMLLIIAIMIFAYIVIKTSDSRPKKHPKH